MALGGPLLRITTTVIRMIQFLCSIVILGIFAYYLVVLARQGISVNTWIRAAEGMAGAAALYTLIAIALTCFLGGLTIFAFLAILLDICFIGCFVAIAIFTKGSVQGCAGVSSRTDGLNVGDLGINDSGDQNYSRSLCNLEKAVFILAIISVVLFIISAILQLLLGRHHQKEKRYGPGPSNNYTSGSERKRFGRSKKKVTKDTELGMTGVRATDETMTGSTVAAPGATYGGHDKYAEPMVAHTGHHHETTHGTGLHHGTALGTTEYADGAAHQKAGEYTTPAHHHPAGAGHGGGLDPADYNGYPHTEYGRANV